MKIICWKLLFMVVLLWSCSVQTDRTAFYEPGVSHELATWRKGVVQGLKYQLFFNIPAQKSLPVDGKETISFFLDQPQEMIVDFRNDSEFIKFVEVNGMPSQYTFSNEHLIIPKNEFKVGENRIYIEFTAGNQSLNRNEDFLYTLLVPDRARTVFPCFEQPDLKGEFSLALELPEEWKAISATYPAKEEKAENGRKIIHFKPTEPLSTYLFSFVCGKFASRSFQDGERTIQAFYRETDPKKVAQLDDIFKEVVYALHWQEEFTGIVMPFSKYEMVILPGFQFGGMEHVGAILYNDMSMFLNENATLDEKLQRVKLIAHETSHMWFGDDVTMEWFNDVWTKEVFANYFAACITEPLFPKINHDLNWMRTYDASSLLEDRTPGTYPIKQELTNLRNAGLLYGQILYNKAPVVMRKLVETMGEENFRKGIQEYLRVYHYSNATWEALVSILDNYSDQDLKAFSQVWVHEKGMPHIQFTCEKDQLKIVQRDPYDRGLVWPQSFEVRMHADKDTVLKVTISDTLMTVPLPFEPEYVIPNSNGRGYGLMLADDTSMKWMLKNWQSIPDETERQAVLMLLNENYLARRVEDQTWMNSLLEGIPVEANTQILSSVVSYMITPLLSYQGDARADIESKIYQLSKEHPVASCRQQLLRILISKHESEAITQELFKLWREQSHALLNANDYTTLSYELCIRCPESVDEILKTQRSRLQDPDRIRKFEFIARAVAADTEQLDSLFNSLMKPENRRIEPWTAELLSYLNHSYRGDYSVKFIRPALEALEDIQRTGDIFFPANWVHALLKNHHSKAAYLAVSDFFKEHPDYSVLLKNKILQAAYHLYRAYDSLYLDAYHPINVDEVHE